MDPVLGGYTVIAVALLIGLGIAMLLLFANPLAG